MAKKETLKSWLDHQADSDSAFKENVEQRLKQLSFKDVLVKARTDRKISQAALSRSARISQPYLAKLERGQIQNVELKTLARLAAALDLELKVELTGV